MEACGWCEGAPNKASNAGSKGCDGPQPLTYVPCLPATPTAVYRRLRPLWDPNITGGGVAPAISSV